MYQVQIAQSIAIIQKAGQAVVPALHDVLRDAGKVDVIRPGFRRHSRPSLRVAPFELYRR
ncbi:hypothetical protein TB9_22580 [Xanthomonas perforans]|uniref:Uncharacterized protein n=1 Tax=Xanthomonas perforans TaxID=442694 RepID=A0ABR5EY00_XANPE|nr:hypothetical protein XP420_18030 [Xanthomonas perforans]KLC08586.1 hypothetical protein XP4B_17000 [Xanthomonas perforans]KLC11098.1 hypothetical protein XP315_00735 [Xanthomonas perforans]KLC14978.1 hypothetical protein XP56_18900 [Xanthomonas perforans]KLC24935.1 hypothetical protein XP712_00305 [Xanthomonas perforans]